MKYLPAVVLTIMLAIAMVFAVAFDSFAGQQLQSVTFGGTIWACGNRVFTTNTDTWTNNTGKTIYITSGEIWSGTDYQTIADTNGMVVDPSGNILGRQFTDRYANPNVSNTNQYAGGNMGGNWFAVQSGETLSLIGNCQRYLTLQTRHIQYWSTFWYVTAKP